MSDHNWMRQSIVDILKYLPEFLARSQQFKATNDADSKEHDAIRTDLQCLLDQFYVETTTWGIERWEELVGITPQIGAGIEARRAAVMLKLKKPPSVTVAFLEKLINEYIADKSGTVIYRPETYSADFNVPLLNKENMAGVTRDVRIYIPAHIGAVYKEIEKRLAQQNMAMIKATTKTVNIYPASLEKIEPETPYYVAMAMTMTEELTLTIGGI